MIKVMLGDRASRVLAAAGLTGLETRGDLDRLTHFLTRVLEV